MAVTIHAVRERLVVAQECRSHWVWAFLPPASPPQPLAPRPPGPACILLVRAPLPSLLFRAGLFAAYPHPPFLTIPGVG